MAGLVLSGFLGTGKSTVAPLVARTLGLPWVDTDAELAREAGAAVPDLWRTLGEGRFRELEGALLAKLLTDGVPRVLAVGGGAVTVRSTRHLALERSSLVTLTARPETILGRIPDLDGRPVLLAERPLARIEALLEQRSAAYAECHLAVPTDGLSPEEVAARVVRGVRRETLAVPLGERTYRVDFVHDAPEALEETLAALGPSTLVVVSDRNVRAARSAYLSRAVRGLGVPITDVTLEPGEAHKGVRALEGIWTAALAGGCDRRSVVLAFGGGVVGDLAGFAAATLLRGLRVVQAPTSLLAMVDASVGGKTGLDVPGGKNAVGAFHQPSAVVIDTAHLETLPAPEVACGLAEMAKIALALDAALWRDLGAGPSVDLRPLLRRAVALKARVVRDDERDAGGRLVLNLGHTLGHALEAAGGFATLRHGEAVALGLVLESTAAERLGVAPSGLAGEVRAKLAALGLPTEVSTAELRAAWPFVAADKKRAGLAIDLPLPSRIGECAVHRLPIDQLGKALGAFEPG